MNYYLTKMKFKLSLFFIITTLIFSSYVEAQVANKARRKPAKKVAPKPLPPPAPVVEPVHEPTLEETKTWVIEKILKYKPIIYFSSNIVAKNNCEYKVTAATFDQNDNLILHLNSEPTSSCFKDQLQSITINFSLIDVKRTNTVETTKRVLLFPQTLQKPFELIYAQNSPMKKQNIVQFNTIVAFDKGAAYEPDLATRLGKAFVKLYEFKYMPPKEKEAY